MWGKATSRKVLALTRMGNITEVRVFDFDGHGGGSGGRMGGRVVGGVRGLLVRLGSLFRRARKGRSGGDHSCKRSKSRSGLIGEVPNCWDLNVMFMAIAAEGSEDLPFVVCFEE